MTGSVASIYESFQWGRTRGLRTTVAATQDISTLVQQEIIIGNPHEDRLQFARSVAQFGQALSELKKKHPPIPAFNNVEEATTFIPKLGASDRFMQLHLKEKWIPVEVGSPQERDQTVENVRLIFQDKSNPAFSPSENKPAFEVQFADMLMRERRTSSITTYHGADGNIATVYDVYTLITNTLGLTSLDLVPRAFFGPFAHFNHVDKFIAAFADETGLDVDNYDKKIDGGSYTTMGMSAVPGLFLGLTARFYLSAQTAKIFDGRSLLNTFLTFLGVSLTPHQWEESLYTQENWHNGVMLQFMLPLALSQRISYNAHTGGPVFTHNNRDLRDTQLLADFRDDPTILHGKDTDKSDESTIQTRHMVHPLYLPAGRIATTRAKPVDRTLLSRAVTRLVAQALLDYREIPKGAFFEAHHPDAPYHPLALRAFYHTLYTARLEPALAEAPLTLSLLPTFIQEANIAGMELLLNKFPHDALVTPFETLGGKGNRAGHTSTFFEALLETAEEFGFDQRLVNFALTCIRHANATFGNLQTFLARVPDNVRDNLIRWVLPSGNVDVDLARAMKEMGYDLTLAAYFRALASPFHPQKTQGQEYVETPERANFLRTVQDIFALNADEQAYASSLQQLMEPVQPDNNPPFLPETPVTPVMMALKHGHPQHALYLLRTALEHGGVGLATRDGQNILHSIMDSPISNHDSEFILPFFASIQRILADLPTEQLVSYMTSRGAFFPYYFPKKYVTALQQFFESHVFFMIYLIIAAKESFSCNWRIEPTGLGCFMPTKTTHPGVSFTHFAQAHFWGI